MYMHSPIIAASSLLAHEHCTLHILSCITNHLLVVKLPPLIIHIATERYDQDVYIKQDCHSGKQK